MLQLSRNSRIYSNLLKNIHNPSRASFLLQSTKTAIDDKDAKSGQKDVADEMKFTEININTKTHQKLPQREPLVKNFFMGQVDMDLITYPEVLPREDVTNMFETQSKNSDYFARNSETVPLKNILQELNLFGSNIPQTFYGKELLGTEETFLSEVEAENLELGLLVNIHRSISQIILDHGSDEQKVLYLPKLAKGDIVATAAVFEPEPSATGEFQTIATFNADDHTYTVNGTKSYVLNGCEANLLLVIVNTPVVTHTGETIQSPAIFLIDQKASGVEVSPPEPTLGCRNLARATIKFNNVKLTKKDIIGQPIEGPYIAFDLLRLWRIQISLLSTIRLKEILRDSAEYAIRTKQSGVYVKDQEVVKNRVARTACATYALESMLYMTTSLKDAYTNQDLEVETAILKVFAIENLWVASCDSMYSMGERCLKSGENTERYIRDAAQLMAQGEPLDSLKLIIGLSGLQHSGLQINDIVKKERNPLLYPGYILSKVFQRKSIVSPKITLNLGHNLHPSLDPAAQWLEQSIKRLQISTETLLTRHGHEVISRQLDVMRLADAATLCYAMFASAARASRSYCIGLKHADYEMLMANTFCNDATEKIILLVQDIEKGEFLTNDKNLGKIGKQVFKSKGYFSEHPLTRNF